MMHIAKPAIYSVVKRVTLLMALLLSSILFSIILAEFIVRLFYPQPLLAFSKNTFKQSEEFGYHLVPNKKTVHSQPEYTYGIESNSFGFRGKEPNIRVSYRVLMFGDSFGMGQGVGEGKYLSALSQLYFTQKKMDVDIFNTSISGYAGVNQLPIFERFINIYKPQMVILFFCWNDVGVKESLLVQDGYLFLGGGKKLGSIREWLNNNSHLFSLVKRFYYTRIKGDDIQRTVSRKYPEEDIDIAINYIKKMKYVADKNGSSFLVVIVPLPFEGIKEFPKDKDYLINSFRKESIIYDDWALLLSKGKQDNIWYKHDGHWTEYGNYYFSKRINEFIEDKFFIFDKKEQPKWHEERD